MSTARERKSLSTMPKTTKTALVRHESRWQAPTQPAATAGHHQGTPREARGGPASELARKGAHP